jgi:hypothetical protein
MERYAIIKDGVVVNVIEYDAAPNNPPPGFGDGHTAVKDDISSPGWVYSNGQFTDPNPTQVVEPPANTSVSLAEQILSNPTELAKLKAALGLS